MKQQLRSVTAIATTCLLGNLVAIDPPKVIASEANCQRAIESTRVAIENLGTYVTMVRFQEASFPKSPYQNKPQSILFGVGRRPGTGDGELIYNKALNFMKSPKMQQGFASQIIRDCPSVAQVAFNLTFTGYTEQWSYRGEFGVLRDDCVFDYDPRTTRLQWGQAHCL